MKKKIIKLDVDQWFSNRLLRLCSPAARGFLIDVQMLCVPSGYLEANGQPLKDEQVASLTGSTVAKVKEYFKELAAANAYEVDEDRGMLCFPDMVKDAKFKEQATISGAKASRKPAKNVPAAKPIKSPRAAEMLAKPATPEPPPPLAKSVIPPKQPAPWYKTPAGWARKGNEQAVSKKLGESFEEFQFRIAKRLPDGPHLDVLPKYMAKQIREDIAKHEKKEED